MIRKLQQQKNSYVQAKRNDEITMYSQVIFQNQNDMTFERRSILDYSEYKAWATSSTEVIGITCTKRTCFMIEKHYVRGISSLQITHSYHLHDS